jgi:light-regulated signal transduction histidine kinase (bacteriophytochrome)
MRPEEVEALIEARTATLQAELASLRKEMQDFTYVVSHDLRAPIRHIVSFAQIVQEDAGPQLSEEVQGFLRTMTDSARHLGAMLDALRELSQAGTAPLHICAVPLQPLVQEEASALQAKYAGRTIGWHIASDFPEVSGDQNLIRMVLHQVLDNAVKFTARTEPAAIHIAFHQEENRIALEVRDNGAGFNAAKQAQLFQPFQRLHSSQEFDGLGMGLALVRKSMERMHGVASAESVSGGGCTIRLQWPLPHNRI